MTVVNTSSAIIASRSTGGDPSDNTCDYGSVSADGRYVVFTSAGSNLVSGDANNKYDVFLFDAVTGVTKLVSRSVGGGVGGGDAGGRPSDVSDDGRWVAFSSPANDLVANDPNTSISTDVFVRDMKTGATTRIGEGDVVGLSGDGRYLVYNASNDEIPGDTNGRVDVYIRDLFTGQTSVLSQSTSGVVGDDASSAVGMSHDGRFVAFQSYARNLVANDATGNPDVYLRDRLTGTTTLISVNSGEVQANGTFSSSAYVSDNGRYVAFSSDATNLVVSDSNGQSDTFVRDTVAGTTKLVSVAMGGALANSSSLVTGMSADGRFVLFESDATNLVEGDTNGLSDVFVRDLVAGSTIRVSVGVGGAQFDHQVFRSAISEDGRYVTFSTYASQLPQPDFNGAPEIYRVSLVATSQADYLLGSDGADSINAGAGDDVVYASGGADTIDGGTGVDTMTGGDGDDRYYVDVAGAGGTGDRVFEGPEGGNDTIFARVSYALSPGTFVETLSCVSATATTTMNLTGNEVANTLIGNAGANKLNGREGADVLTGLGGKDVFLFDRALGPANVDVITDFTHGVDQIALDRTIFTKLAVGALPAAAFKDFVSAAEDADDRILYNHVTGGLFYDADGAGGAAAVRFATLQNHPAVITAADFVIVA